jgi:TolA-binding protein
MALLTLVLGGCAGTPTYQSSDSIGSLKGRIVKVEEEKIEGGLEKAMASYQQFLKETPEGEMTPEALRRLADLKVDSVEGVYGDQPQLGMEPGKTKVLSPLDKRKDDRQNAGKTGAPQTVESMESRSKDIKAGDSANRLKQLPTGDAMSRQVLEDDANSKEAIRIYKELLTKYPDYERNDQVLYQLARAYGIRGEQEQAMVTLDRVVHEYPYTPLVAEVQFRRGEILFVRKRYYEAEQAYAAVLKAGRRSEFYDVALYKHGWSLFKQSEYDRAMDSFIRLVDYKAAGGRDAIEGMNEIERQRLNDTLRVISFSFSYTGGADAIGRFLDTHGKRPYEDMLYTDLGEHYLEKRRYADAAATFARYVERNPLDARAPVMQRRVIDVYEKGGFPKLVIDGKRDFAATYDIKGNFWRAHDIGKQPDMLAFIKQNLIDLASHYHALSQKRGAADEYKEAITWYGKYLESFSSDAQAPRMNFLLAEVLYDNKQFAAAAAEYEKTAYQYPKHDKAAEAGYAAILAYHEQVKPLPAAERAPVVARTVTSSLRFVDTFPSHPKAAPVLTEAAAETFKRGEFANARELARRVVGRYPDATPELQRASWTVIAHSSFDLKDYPVAEQAYLKALELPAKNAADNVALQDRLAATVYKQGEQKLAAGDQRGAVEHFLKVGTIAPKSAIRATADYDAASTLIRLKDWKHAATVLEDFRRHYPGHERQADVTQKLAVVYEENRRWELAAREFETIEKTTKDASLRREANFRAAELYAKADRAPQAIGAYDRFVRQYPNPVGEAIEARQKLADLYRKQNDDKRYTATLRDIVADDRRAGKGRNDRTRYLAAMATFELSEPVVETYRALRLKQPLKQSLAKKKQAMEKALKVYSDMLDFGVADVTAAATYRIADIYYDLSRAILESDRPGNLSALELEQYNILLEEQSYPFEEKSIKLHEKNVELLARGIYSDWIEKSLKQLGKLVPVRYLRTEQGEIYAPMH